MGRQDQPVHPFLIELGKNIEKLSNAMEAFHHYQAEQSGKTPFKYTTVGVINVPDPTQPMAIPVQIAPGRGNRKFVYIYNSGSNPVTIGNTPDQAQTNGFILPSGGTSPFAMETQDAVFAWATTAKASTVCVLETLYDLHGSIEQLAVEQAEGLKHRTARFDTGGDQQEEIPNERVKNPGVEEIVFKDTDYK